MRPIRYRLRTLMIGLVLGPPLLALAWYATIVTRYGFSAAMLEVSEYLLRPCVVCAIGLVVFSLFAPAADLEPRLRPWQIALLWCAEFLALWHWLWLLCAIGGWLLLWGDRGPPVSEFELSLIAAAMAACVATLASIRISSGSASSGYVVFVGCLSGWLLGIAGLFWLARLLR